MRFSHAVTSTIMCLSYEILLKFFVETLIKVINIIQTTCVTTFK